MSDTLLTTDEVATFVARGFLEFPGIVPDALNAAASDEMRTIMATWGSAQRPFAPASGDAWSDIYPAPSAIGAVLRLPVVRRIVDSLVGPVAMFDHDFVHVKPPRDRTFQPLHADAVVDPNTVFDILLFYFPYEVHPGGG